MGRSLRIAIYSGIIPSPPFLERLINGLAADGMTVLLFGSVVGKLSYGNPRIQVIGNRNSFLGFFIAAGRCLKLRITRPDRYQSLKKYLGGGPFSGSRFRKWRKYAPVVLHLPDIFHVQWAKAAGEWLFLKTLFGVRMVLSLRGSHINYSPLADTTLADMYRSVFPLYDAFHAVSESMLAESIQYGVRIERARVIYSGVELQGLAEKPLCIEDSTVRLLIIGRMHWIKGYSYLLDCLQILKERGVAVNATIIAGGDVPEEFLYHVHEAGLSQIVELRGSLPHAEVIAEMSKHHALVLPSVAEGIANVVLEAMSNGLLVISTDCGGMREVVCDGINGFLISVRDAEAMANAVIKLKALSKEEINQLRRNAYRTVEQKFKLAANIKNFVELYQSLN